jgi:carbonic anhydrase/acetyltransferase-like protein (isoleucine patch superfamily)
MLIEYQGKLPRISPTAFIAPTAVVIGDVEVCDEASIWFGAVVRGDRGSIRIGARSNVQDNAVIHVSEVVGETIVEEDVTIGHGAILEDCVIGSGSLVGINAVVLNGARVGSGTIVAAGSVVGERADIPDGVLAAGAPAVVKKQLGPAATNVKQSAEHYVERSRSYLAQGIGAPEQHDVVASSLTH